MSSPQDLDSQRPSSSIDSMEESGRVKSPEDQQRRMHDRDEHQKGTSHESSQNHPTISLITSLLEERKQDMEDRLAEREQDRKDRQSNNQREVALDYRDIGGEKLLGKLKAYAASFHDKPTTYWEDFFENRPEEINSARGTLKKFWERTLDWYNAGLLPDDFLGKGSTWLQSGHNYRTVSEPIDIANYYRLGLWRESGHYLEHENRPHPYLILHEKWAEAYGEDVDTITLAHEMEKRAEQGNA